MLKLMLTWMQAAPLTHEQEREMEKTISRAFKEGMKASRSKK